LTDKAKQDWMVYHAIDQTKPFIYPNATTPNRRPLMMDPLDWVDGWPVVRGGLGPSATSMPAPAAQPGQKSHYTMQAAPMDQPGAAITNLSDDFNGASLSPQWTWVRPPAAGTFAVENGSLRFDTQDADLHESSNNASVLTEPTPQGDYLVEIKVKETFPAKDCCFNFRQGGMVIYKDDDNFVKLAHVAIFGTRISEFAKEWGPAPKSNYPRYGNSEEGAPGEWSYYRIVKTTSGSNEVYRSYTSTDGTNWERGAAWTHALGANAKIGLISMGGKDYQSLFDYVHVYQLQK
jgi:arabinan endo-1,5-alpha-L-arabinosidase